MHILLSIVAVIFFVRLLKPLVRQNGRQRCQRALRIVAVGLGALFLFSSHAERPSQRSLADDRAADTADVTGTNAVTEDDDHASASLHSVSTERFGETVVLFVTDQNLRKLPGTDDAEALTGLTGLQQAYAMIPLPVAGPSALPKAMQEALSPAGIRILQTALMQIIALSNPGNSKLTEIVRSAEQDAVSDGTTSLAEADGSADTLKAESTPDLAHWVNDPGIGQTVVKSDFLEATIAPEDALRDPILQALKARITRLAQQQFGADLNWEQLVNVTLTDQAVRRCIVTTDARTQVIETRDGSHPMRQTYALVEIPETVEQQVLHGIETALRENRLVTLCLTVGFLWLAVVLFSAACRATQQGTLLRKLATFPAMAFLIVPCLLTCAMLINAMISGQTVPYRSDGARVTCVVDRN
ncbi:MAG: hypothetical protein R3C59_29700 [Planctomycetaceae bacterium]